jgi:hypothetical protein
MQNGMYCARFSTPLGQGAGVVTLVDGKITGGDSSMYYSGTYSTDGSVITAKVTTGEHTDVPGMIAVLGSAATTIELSGTVSGSTAKMTGKSAQAPGVTMGVTLQPIG